MKISALSEAGKAVSVNPSSQINESENPLGYIKISKLLFRFAVPSIISMLVSAFYNIVDQFFIGQGIGIPGIAATNIAFPLTTLCTATALLVGLGGASAFGLALGESKVEGASKIAGNAITLMVLFGIAFAAIVLVFLQPLLVFLGTTETVTPFAKDYIGIIALGIPFIVFSHAFSFLIRADGRPAYSMVCVLTGAVINIILDPLFIFTFGWGIKGAAYATVIGQIVAGILCFRYAFKMHCVKLNRWHFHIDGHIAGRILSLGLAAFITQIAIALTQVVLNNVLHIYGAQTIYGADIPLAVAGIVAKCSAIFMAVNIGFAQGFQPIVSFNYGARQYKRVREAWNLAVICSTAFSFIGFLCFQLFPLQIVRLFGEGTPLYYEYAVRYFRIYMMMFFLMGIHPITQEFFPSIGKPMKGILVALARQIILFIPLMLLLSHFMGLDGVMWASPITDTASAMIAVAFAFYEFRIIARQK
jgi:putative MATE family efflux protein